MPRKPVEKVIEHRISLGQYERDQLDTISTGYAFNRVAQPIVALLSDVSALLAIISILEVLGIIDLTKLGAKLGGQGLEWMNQVRAGIFASVNEALSAWEERVKAMIPDWLPGGEPLFEWPSVDFGPSDAELSASERAWLMTQIYSQQPQTFTSPADVWGS